MQKPLTRAPRGPLPFPMAHGLMTERREQRSESSISLCNELLVPLTLHPLPTSQAARYHVFAKAKGDTSALLAPW